MSLKRQARLKSVLKCFRHVTISVAQTGADLKVKASGATALLAVAISTEQLSPMDGQADWYRTIGVQERSSFL